MLAKKIIVAKCILPVENYYSEVSGDMYALKTGSLISFLFYRE